MNDHELDELQLLRSIRSSDSDPTEAEIARGLAGLERAIGADTNPAPRSRARASFRRPRTAIWATIGVVTIGAMIGIAVVVAPSSLMGPITQRDPEARATALLERSAELLPDLEVGEGQYLRAETNYQQVMSKPVLEGGEAVTYMTRENRVNYVPYDLADAWTFRSEEKVPTEILVPSGDAAADKKMIDLVKPHLALGIKADQYLAGQFPLTADGKAQAAVAASTMDADSLRRRNAPTDPEKLRSFLLEEFRLKDAPGIVISEDEKGLVFTEDGAYYALSEDEAIRGEISEIVSDQLMPSELRAACLKLLTKMPGMAAQLYIPSSQSSISSSLSSGTATVITVQERNGEAFQLIFDEESARLIGTQSVLTERNDNYPGLKPGTVVFIQSFETTVVEAVPETETW